MKLSRRTVLGGATASALTLITSRKSAAQSTTITPVTALNRHALPNTGLGYPGYRVLEIFLHGGVAPWDTFYWVDRPEWRNASIDGALRECGGGPVSPSATTMGNTPDGLPILWGPPLAPIHPFMDASRIVVHRNEFGLHPLAVPMQMSGQRVGSPRLAGAGAAIQRYFAQMRASATLPRSYILSSSGATADNLPLFAATGAHGAGNRPVELHLGMSLSADIDSFDRTPSAGPRRTEIDPLIDALRAHYASGLSTGGSRLRSRALDELEAAYRTHHRSRALYDVLRGTWPVPPGLACRPGANFETGQAIDLATLLLNTTAPDGDALGAYVGIIDSGMRSFGGAGYDTHGGRLPDYGQAYGGNLNGTLRHLASKLSRTAAAGKIDLNNTLVIITTEFGRTINGDRDAHNNTGYASVLIGGPYLRVPGSARAASGSLDRSGNAPLTFPASTGVMLPTTPTSFRAAILMAAGIGPVEPATLFSTADLEVGVTPPPEVERALAADVLGFPA